MVPHISHRNAGPGLHPWMEIDPSLRVTLSEPTGSHHFHSNQSTSSRKQERQERQMTTSTEVATAGIPGRLPAPPPRSGEGIPWLAQLQP